MAQEFKFEDLMHADLIVDAAYRGGIAGDAGDDPISKLLKCSIRGGFRYLGSVKNLALKLVVLYSGLSDPDWPDLLDIETGQFTYFGDNKTPGRQLHQTPRYGNVILRDCFENAHKGQRNKVPPFFVFTKGDQSRDVVFKGLAVPGAPGLSTDDLVATWKSVRGERFQNYKAIFTILDAATIPRAWLDDVINGNPLSPNCPQVWRKWVEKGIYAPLQSSKTVEYRSKEEQLPSGREEGRMVQRIFQYFQDNPCGFENCAAELFTLMDKNVISYDLTRPWMDGGRDAMGKYRIGLERNSIEVEFALEAKCYKTNHGVGVKETSRLISRLKYRQFGIFVTTSYVHRQAYREIKEDRHPVIVISARDIAQILKQNGYGTGRAVQQWLLAKFPKNPS